MKDAELDYGFTLHQMINRYICYVLSMFRNKRETIRACEFCSYYFSIGDNDIGTVFFKCCFFFFKFLARKDIDSLEKSIRHR